LQYKLQHYQRLKKNKDFQSVLSNSKKVSCENLVAIYQENDKLTTRLGVAISKRVARQAILRNRIKRIIRESFRLNQSLLPAMDVVVIVRSGEGIKDKKKLREIIDKLWKKLIALSQ